jgi:hypothetical protein
VLIEKIQLHNELNGLVFCAVEFALISLIITPFACFYLSHARFIEGIVALGIATNTLCIAALALHSRIAGQKSIGIRKWFDKNGRAEIAARVRGHERDTMTIVVATLVPFVVVLVCVWEISAASGRKG